MGTKSTEKIADNKQPSVRLVVYCFAANNFFRAEWMMQNSAMKSFGATDRKIIVEEISLNMLMLKLWMVFHSDVLQL